MPNWVYNSINITGTKDDLIAFRDKVSKIAPSGISETGELEYKDENAQAFSFWNIKEPENKYAYFGDAHGTKPEGYEGWTMEQKLQHDLKFEGDGWYDWNVREWGTKWDACDTDSTDGTEEKSPHLYYSFNTAWGIPEGVFASMVHQHPELTFDFESEEEQGWGAKYTSSDGDDVDEDGKPRKSLMLVEEWDIPDSHADYVARGRECNCEHEDDEDYWYEDCPRPERTFVVVVERRFTIKATNAEKAWEIASEGMDTLEPEDADSIRVVDENTGEHLFPVFEESEA